MSARVAVVTGASGFLGSAFARRLVERGYQVRALLRSTSTTELISDLNLEIVRGDLFQPTSLQRALRGAELVTHCAGQVTGWRDASHMIESHVRGTHNVVQAALRQRVGCLLHVSSVASLGVPDMSLGRQATLTESHVWNAGRTEWPYGFAQYHAEIEAWRGAAAGLDVRVVLPSYVLGPGGPRQRGGEQRMRWLAARMPPLAPQGGLNVVHLQDVVDGTMAAIEHGHSGQRYLLSGHNLTHKQFLTALADIAAVKPPRATIPAAPLRAVGALAVRLSPLLPAFAVRLPMLTLAGRFFYYDNQRTAQRLGLQPRRPFRPALAAALERPQATAG